MTNIYIEKALDLVKRGYTVIPLSGKAPMITGWQNLRHLTPAHVYDWDRGNLWRNIGMVTGAASNNTVVIDFDGLAGYELFKAAFPELVNTMTVATGSGNGMHCYYKSDLLPDSKALLDIPVDGGELINIEFKSDGKQVVIPPSIHPDTQKPYSVVNRAPIMVVSDLAKVWTWAQSLKPQDQKQWQPPASYSTSTNLNPKLLAAVESYFMAQPHKMHRDWINCSCPDKLAHKHGDQNPSFGYHPSTGSANCFQCGGMSLKELLPLIGINAADYGGFYEKNEAPYDVRVAGPSISPASRPAPVSDPTAITVVKRSTRLTNYIDRVLDYDRPIENPPVPFPMRVLHQFKGMAEITRVGKLIGIVGVSGGGKTSLLETMIDGLLSFHVPSLVWSPEWDADEFVERAVQRYGGPSTAELYKHENFIHEFQNGIKDGIGVELSKEKVESAKSAIKVLRGWTDEVGYLDMPDLTMGYLQASIEATLKSIDFKPRVLAIDYIQLFHALETDPNLTMYNLLMRIKTICAQYKLVGIVASQVTKASTKDQKNGKLLDSQDARYVNDDAFNLFVTINPDFHEVTGERLYSAVLNVAKNSMGIRGKVRVAVDWEHLSFSDKPHANQVFGTGESE